ncbi:MAG: hypothetical protein H6Q17_2048 [Bacteroidetes bacterium]|nr:hypothetical protein [Bacteroidota bacterium]
MVDAVAIAGRNGRNHIEPGGHVDIELPYIGIGCQHNAPNLGRSNGILGMFEGLCRARFDLNNTSYDGE